MYCSKCGSQVKAGSRFCQNCGNRIDVAAVKVLKAKRYYIRTGDRYYTNCDNWSIQKGNGMFFSTAGQAENVIRAAHLRGAYVSEY